MRYERIYDIQVDFTNLVQQEKSLVRNRYKMLRKLENNVQGLYERGLSNIIHFSEYGKLYPNNCYDTKNLSKHFEPCLVLVKPGSRWG